MLTPKGISGHGRAFGGMGSHERCLCEGNGLEVEVDDEEHTHPTFHFVEGNGCVLMDAGEKKEGRAMLDLYEAKDFGKLMKRENLKSVKIGLCSEMTPVVLRAQLREVLLEACSSGVLLCGLVRTAGGDHGEDSSSKQNHRFTMLRKYGAVVQTPNVAL